MKIATLGAGAMGSVVGAYLQMGGADVAFVDSYEEICAPLEPSQVNLKFAA